MPNPPSDGLPQEPDASQLLAEVRQILQEAKSVKEQTEAYLKQIETAARKADSEALLAFNAKKACEEHATSIANIKGAVDAEATTIATNKQRSDEMLAALTTAKATADADIKAVESRRKEIDQSAADADLSATNVGAAYTAASTDLEDLRTLKRSAEGLVTAATASSAAAALAATEANSAQKQTEQASAQAAALVTNMSEEQTTTAGIVTEVQALRVKALASEEKLKAVLDHIAKSDDFSTSHEKQVEDLGGQLKVLIESVEGLLPGATSAGLASSFNKQRARFTGPQKQWLWIFVVCIAILFLVAIPSFLSAIGWTTHQGEQSWDATWRSLFLRLPIVFPLVWLAIYAGRNYMMSLRMEEDYAYKEAVSTSFEGYKREMEKIADSDDVNPTPLKILCTNILRAIAERPGRIYEGKQKDINLLTEVQELVEKGGELSKKKLATH